MSFFNRNIYVPPDTYTRTLAENPVSGVLAGLKIPVFLGTGNEVLSQQDFELIRGSSSNVDQEIVSEDETGRAVVAVLDTGAVTLGAFNGVRTRFQVRNLPIVDGSGRGQITTRTDVVSVTVDGVPLVVAGVDGANGIVELVQAPAAGAEVKCSYFFNREDTLTTDNVSAQVTTDPALLQAAKGGPFTVVTGTNDEFIVSADGSDPVTITIPVGTWTASQIAVYINTEAPESLVASAFLNNRGENAVQLSADQSITIGAGSLNALVGFSAGSATSRNATFVTFQRPIVDGSNGGITTTDPSDVTVKVDGVQIIPTSVDGSTGSVVLPFAPKSGSIVTVQYFFNTFENTFDYLRDVGVLSVSRAGVAPGRNDFIQGADFVLSDDKIYWGTSASVAAGETTVGATAFDSSQVSTTLVDNKEYLALATPTSSNRRSFQLPNQPTTGNGRNSPLGTSLFQTVSNDRIDLPTNRPDLVTAYWGFGVQDALARGPVTVLTVESSTSTMTLKDPVPAGASVFATFYYNRLNDGDYTLTVVNPGISGVGTYRVTDSDQTTLRAAKFGAKTAALTGINVNFPSGTEVTPDARFEGVSATTFTGPVDETVTVTFADKDATPAKFTVGGSGPYEFFENASDRARIQLDSADLTGFGSAGLDLANPTGIAGVKGFFASLSGDEINYDDATGDTTFTITSSNNSLNLSVDGVLVESTVTAGAGLTVADFVTSLNTAAAATAPKYVTAARFTSSTVIAVDEYNQVSFVYSGDSPQTTGVLTATIAAGTYTTATALAAALDSGIAAVVAGLGIGFAGLSIDVSANANGELVFELTKATADANGYLEFVDNTSTIATEDLTITGVTGAVGDTITIAGLDLVGVVGARTPGADDFDASLGSGALIATEIAAAINDAANSWFGIVTASPAANVVTISAATAGSAGNLLGIAVVTETTVGTYTVAGASLTAGAQASEDLEVLAATTSGGDILTIAGIALTGVAGARTPGSNDFETGLGSVAFEATEIAAAINDGANGWVGIVTASALAGVVTITAVDYGTDANSLGLVITNEGVPATYSVGAATLSGGVDPVGTFSVLKTGAVGDVLTIEGVTLTGVAGTRTAGSNNFSVAATTTAGLATEMAAAINDAANGFDGFVTAVASGSNVILTGTSDGASGVNVGVVITTESVNGTFGVPGILLAGGTGGSAADFATLAGIDTDTSAGGVQTKLCDVEIARRVTIVGASGALNHDRIVFRNRLLPGSGSMLPYHQVNQTQLTVEGSSAALTLGLTTNTEVSAGYQATITKPSLVGHVGFSSGQGSSYGDARDGQPLVKFYAAGGVTAQNNVFKFNLDGTTVVVEFTDDAGVAIASGASAEVPLGPATVANTVLNQIATAMASAGLGASAAAVLAAGLLSQEGDAIRIVSALETTSAFVEIGDGSATSRLGFTAGQSAVRENVPVDRLASALMSHSHATLSDYLFSFGSPTSGYFAGSGLALVEEDASGNEYLFTQSLSLGLSSNVVFAAATADDFLLPGTLIGVVAGEGDTGEEGISGFYVTSTDGSSGSGSVNTSVFNSGVGQDGVVGQTYRDLVTGLTFSILDRDGGLNYPNGSSFTLVVSSLVLTDANIPVLSIPGVELVVSNTTGTVAGDTAVVSSFDKSGAEPAVGDIYYVSYTFTKQDFSTKLFTKLSVIEQEYGSVSPDNPVSLAAYLAFINGAIVIGINQIAKQPGSNVASVTDYVSAIDDLTAPLPGGISPDFITPLIGSSLDLFRRLSIHLDIMSSPRFQSERTAIVGVTSGTAPETVKTWAQSLSAQRMRIVYPDAVTITLTDQLGINTEYLIDGYFMAAALVGQIVRTTSDVASPWTRKQLFGFTELARKLNVVEKNEIAQSGVTVMDENLPQIRVRQGFTTDMTNVITRTPTIIQISDEVQQRARSVLGRFIGTKFLRTVIGRVEGELSTMLKGAQEEQIISAFTGVSAQVSPDDPTALEAEAYYAPIFPLLYIFVTFHLRSSL